MIKMLFQTGARVSKFAGILVEDLFFEELMILINKGEGCKSRYAPILAELAQELRTHLGDRETGYLFETNHHSPYSPRRIRQVVKATAEKAKFTKRVYPHLLRRSVAATLFRVWDTYRADTEVSGPLEIRNDANLCRVNY